ncbi:MAG: lysostaphin resistance A-like protein [bacterium]
MASKKNWIPSAVDTYHRLTRSYFFGLLIILVPLLIYESSSALAYQGDRTVLRNAAELMIKRTFWYFGLRQSWMYWFIYAAILGWAYWLAKKDHLLALQFPYFPYAIFESLFYALSLSTIIHLISRSIVIEFLSAWTNGIEAGLGERMALALGAGIYEELLFRFGFLGVLLYFFQKTWPVVPFVHKLLAVTISAALFSVFHYWSGREAVTADSFYYRFYAGIVLGALYLWRGLGVAVYTHAFYDLLLVFQRPPSTIN